MMPLINKPEQEVMVDLKKYWRIVLKSKLLIVTFVLLSTVLAIFIVQNITPIYQATSSLLIKADKENTVSIDAVASFDPSRQDYFSTQFEILKSRSVTEQVIDELFLLTNPEFLPKPKNPTILKIEGYLESFLAMDKDDALKENIMDLRGEKVKLIETFQENLLIKPVRNTQIVNISFEAKDPLLAAQVANTIGDVYIRQEMEAQLNITQKAVSWLKVRLGQLRDNLDLSENNLQTYRVKENLIDIGSKGVTSIASDELENLTSSYLAAKKARFEAETISLFVGNVRRNNIDALLSLPEISDHTLIKDLKRVEIEAEKKVSEFSFRYGNKHPKSIAAKAELAAVRKSLQERVGKLVQGIAKELKAAEDNERRFEVELQKEKLKFQQITDKEQEYLKLQAEVDANRKLYNTFLNRFKEMESTTDLEIQQARIIDFAEVPLTPVKPQKILIVGGVFVASLAFAILFTLIIDSLNDRFRTSNDVESKLGMRILGLIPLIKSKRKTPLGVYAYFDEKYNVFAEAVRTLRTALVLSHIGADNKVILVTSSIPKEGKTTTAINIAFSLSQMGKTLLIEGDMRRPSFSKAFSLPPYQKGLSNLISGTEKMEDVIIQGKHGLDILTAGFIPTNPIELLSSSRFDQILAELKTRYNYIIIDSAPTQAVSDSLVIAQRSDSVVYVVRYEMTKQSVAKKGIARLLEVDAKIDGIVLNQVDVHKSSKEDSFHGYYDYYGYSNGEKKAQ
ncbi:GumC family protein [Psychromonas sp.]|uniref:GumC family protein n=1 Tax=Psychromonas sp. TaxID=1884585 RepID=UPI00356687A5